MASSLETKSKMILSKPLSLWRSLHHNGVLKLLATNSVLSSKLSSLAIKFDNPLNLPHLPVPPLDKTAEKYLKSVLPFLNENELQTTKTILKQLTGEHGQQLQRLLVQKAKSEENWLEKWWLNVAYLEYRDPVVVYSSPGLVFPLQNFIDKNDQLTYAAKLIAGAVDFKLLVDKNKLPVEKMGKEPLDMNQYKKIFGTCRVPKPKRDELKFNLNSKHIVVVRNNNYFRLEVINNNGEVSSLDQLKCQLEEIYSASERVGPPVGILSTDNRDIWASSYAALEADPENAKSIREIEASLFLVCLDNPMPESNGGRRSMAGRQLIHGGGPRLNSANRWYDKTIQFIVSLDGNVGLTYEHSPSEGGPLAVVTDHIVNFMSSKVLKDLPDTKSDRGIEPLPFKVNSEIEKAIQISSKNIENLANNLDMENFQFGHFGKEFVKSQKLSPDSFIQIAMQYAFYRLHKVPGAHYESAATRKYIHGRTETIRSCSVESINFAKAMLDSNMREQDKANALREAINAHKKYSVEAVHGFGVDRHLLGLKLIAKEHGLKVLDIYDDLSFKRSTHMRLSTSQVATNCDGFMCYGPLVPNGYGCCYNPRPNDINFGVSAFIDNPETSAKRFREALEESLVDMQQVLAKTQKSKL